MSIHLPELKQRTEDIPLLANHFLKKYSRSLEKEVRTISKETLNLLLDYDWPGNVRELEHAIERAVLVCDSEDILPEHLPPEIQFPEERRIRQA
jgi:DNA-binding NtrC family response regulator